MRLQYFGRDVGSENKVRVQDMREDTEQSRQDLNDLAVPCYTPLSC